MPQTWRVKLQAGRQTHTVRLCYDMLVYIMLSLESLVIRSDFPSKLFVSSLLLPHFAQFGSHSLCDTIFLGFKYEIISRNPCSIYSTLYTVWCLWSICSYRCVRVCVCLHFCWSLSVVPGENESFSECTLHKSFDALKNHLGLLLENATFSSCTENKVLLFSIH